MSEEAGNPGTGPAAIHDMLTANAEAAFAKREGQELTAKPDEGAKVDELAAQFVDDEGDDGGVPDIESDTEMDEPAEAAPSELGSEEKPFTIKNIPDQHVTLKVMGEEMTLPLKEALGGYIRQETFNRKVNEVEGLAKQVKEKQEGARQEVEHMRDTLDAVLSDPQRAMEFLAQAMPPNVLNQVARKRMEQMVKFQQLSPEQREAMMQRAHKRQIQQEREAMQQELEQERAQLRKSKAQLAFEAKVKPGIQAALSEAGRTGLPKDIKADLQDLFRGYEARNGAGSLDSEVAKALTHKALKLSAEGAEKAPPKPKKRPATKKPKLRKPAEGKKKRAGSANEFFGDILDRLAD